MSDLESGDVVVRYDPSGHSVSLFTVEKSGRASALRLFYQIDATAFTPATELAQEIGIAALAEFHVSHPEFVVPIDSLNDAAANQAASGLDRARELIGQLGDDSTAAELEAIDAVLSAAAANGDTQADDYLQNMWPRLRSVFVRRISRHGG